MDNIGNVEVRRTKEDAMRQWIVFQQIMQQLSDVDQDAVSDFCWEQKPLARGRR